MPLEVKAGRTRKCHLKVTEQLPSACGPLWAAANFIAPSPPAPASLMWNVPWLPCAVSLQPKQPSMANCWNPGTEKQREEQLSPPFILRWLLVQHLLISAADLQVARPINMTAPHPDSCSFTEWGPHPHSLPSWVFSFLSVKKRREKHSYEASGSTVKWGCIVQCSGNLRLCPSMTSKIRYFTQRENPPMTRWASPLSSLFPHSHRHFGIWLSWFNVFNLKQLFECPLT